MFRYLIAGPCAAESEAQVYETALRLFALRDDFPCPLTFFRCGVWKPRSAADAFCGAGEEAFPWLRRVSESFGFQVCVEVATLQHVETCLRNGVTTIWVGARTAVNPFSVQAVADAVKGNGCTVLVKNPVIPDLKLWLGNLERFEKAGVEALFAVHRGFADKDERLYRNAPMWEVPVALRVARPDIPLLCDPSHIAGSRDLVRQVAQTAVDYGMDGLMVETHAAPANALSDAAQQLTPEALLEMLNVLVYKSQSQNPDDLLRRQRDLIRTIDGQIARLLAQRLSVVEEIANIKREHNIPLVQPAQWNTVVENYRRHALDDSRFMEFLEKYLELLHQYSLRMQQ
jgi:chorismate mutase